ncbi:MAG: hypothetical protein QXU82_01940 [Candidatus Aenigmatarchaeota archaeon]
MQTPICEICLNSDILCGGCQKKLEEGKITSDEVEISRMLFGMSEKTKSLKDAKLKKAMNTEVLLLIAGKGDGAKLVGKAGAVVKALAKKYEKPIRVLEESDIRTFITNMLQPVPIEGINTVFAGGKETFKVRLPLNQKNRLLFSEETFKKVVSEVYGRQAELVFE